MAVMLQWFERVGYSADIAGLEREFGRALTKFPEWARRQSQCATGRGGPMLEKIISVTPRGALQIRHGRNRLPPLEEIIKERRKLIA
jgi:hypothetical protein